MTLEFVIVLLLAWTVISFPAGLALGWLLKEHS